MVGSTFALGLKRAGPSSDPKRLRNPGTAPARVAAVEEVLQQEDGVPDVEAVVVVGFGLLAGRSAVHKEYAERAERVALLHAAVVVDVAAHETLDHRKVAANQFRGQRSGNLSSTARNDTTRNVTIFEYFYFN